MVAQRETLGYDMPGHHTLSLYLRGGEKSFRVGLDSLHGGAGSSACCPPSITRAGA